MSAKFRVGRQRETRIRAMLDPPDPTTLKLDWQWRILPIWGSFTAKLMDGGTRARWLEVLRAPGRGHSWLDGQYVRADPRGFDAGKKMKAGER